MFYRDVIRGEILFPYLGRYPWALTLETAKLTLEVYREALRQAGAGI